MPKVQETRVNEGVQGRHQTQTRTEDDHFTQAVDSKQMRNSLRIRLLLGFVTLIIASCIALHSQNARPEVRVPANGPVGSFQLVQGHYTARSGRPKVGALDQVGLFRIDTRSGATWKYMTGTDESGRFYDGWAPISEGITFSK